MLKEQSKFRITLDPGRELEVSIPHGVFVPTGTTTVLINAIRSYARGPGKALDLGCGAGAVGIALNRLGLVKAPLYASDLGQAAVDSTAHNCAEHQCPVVARCGPLFEPWKNEKFDYIVDDVSGVAAGVAAVSPWFANVSCESGIDGASLVGEVIKQAPAYLEPEGLLFFPIISFSNADKILAIARENFKEVRQLAHHEWPLPKEMYQHLPELERLQEEGHIQFSRKFGMVLWFTDIYVASNFKLQEPTIGGD